MAEPQILETIVTPNGAGALVQLQISDEPLHAEVAAIRLTLAVQVPAFDLPLLAHYQREAIVRADDVLRAIRQQLTAAIQDSRHDLNPGQR